MIPLLEYMKRVHYFMKSVIKQASLKDLESLVSIENQCFDHTKYPLMSKVSFKNLLLKGNALIKIACIGKIVCGMSVIFFRKNSYYGRLYSIAVLPDYQGKDLGKKLFGHLVKDVKAKGLKWSPLILFYWQGKYELNTPTLFIM